MAAVFNGGGGHKVVGHVGEGHGELQGGRTAGAHTSTLASKQRRKGEGGMGKGRGVRLGSCLEGRKGEGGRVRRACSSEGLDDRQLRASDGGGQRHDRRETGEAVPLADG
jgi:hypothetical protein